MEAAERKVGNVVDALALRVGSWMIECILVLGRVPAIYTGSAIGCNRLKRFLLLPADSRHSLCTSSLIYSNGMMNGESLKRFQWFRLLTDVLGTIPMWAATQLIPSCCRPLCTITPVSRLGVS
jgi:hypothetical protein